MMERRPPLITQDMFVLKISVVGTVGIASQGSCAYNQSSNADENRVATRQKHQLNPVLTQRRL